MRRFDPADKLSRTGDLLSTELDEETVLMSVDAGAYYGLEGVAQSAWNILEVPLPFSMLIDRLVAEYAVSAETCIAEIEPFLAEMEREGLLRVE
jgi:hypothetical protein